MTTPPVRASRRTLPGGRGWRVTAADVNAVQARLAPRSRLLVDSDGRIASGLVDEPGYAHLLALLAGARAAMVVSHILEQRHPLLAGVLPDTDGVLRSRWTAE